MFIRQIIDIVGNSKTFLAYYTFLVCDLEVYYSLLVCDLQVYNTSFKTMIHNKCSNFFKSKIVSNIPQIRVTKQVALFQFVFFSLGAYPYVLMQNLLK